MATEGIIAGDYRVYVGAADHTLVPLDLDGPPPSGSWTSLGETKQGEGIKYSLTRSQNKVEAEGTLRPIDVLTSGIEEVLEATLIKVTAENIGITIRGDASSTAITTIAASATAEGAKEVSLDYPSRLPHVSVLFHGLGGPYYDAASGAAFALRAFYPRCAIWGDWELALMLGTEASIPARFLVLESVVAPKFHLQNAPTT